MKRPSVGRQDAGVGGLLGERVLEEVLALGQARPLADQLGAEKASEGAIELGRPAVQRRERTIAEEAPDDRSVLEQRLGWRRQPVDPRGDHPAERRRNGDSRLRSRWSSSGLLRGGSPCLDQGPDDLLDEERIALGLLQDPPAQRDRELGDV